MLVYWCISSLTLVVLSTVTSADAVIQFEDRCAVNASSEITVRHKCTSCDGECGASINQRSLFRLRGCSCDVRCEFYNDCCYDFKKACPESAEEGRRWLNGLAPNLQGETPKCVDSDMLKPEMPSAPSVYSMVRSCTLDPQMCIPSHRSLYNILPVTDTDTGLHFISAACALCNGATAIEPWNLTIRCNTDPDFSPPDDVYALLENLMDRRDNISQTERVCSLSADPPRTALGLLRVCPKSNNFVDWCPRECNNTQLINKCLNYGNEFICSRRECYKNTYCALCNRKPYLVMNCGVQPGGRHMEREFSGTIRTSFPILVDFNPKDGLVVGKKTVKKPSCGKGQLPEVHMCEDGNINFANISKLCHYYKEISDLSRVWETGGIGVSYTSRVQVLFNCPTLLIKVTTQAMNLTLGDNEGIKDILPRVILSVVPPLVNSGIFFNVSVHLNLLSNSSGVTLTKCHLLRFETGTYVVDNNDNLVLNNTGKVYMKHVFAEYDEAAYLCENNNSDMTEPATGLSYALNILTLVLLVISAVALCCRIALHFLLSEFQNSAGRVQLSLVVAILLAVMTFIAGSFVTAKTKACYVFAVCLHWTMLASFTWMTSVAVDIWRMIWRSSYLYHVKRHSRKCIYLSVAGWGIPSLVVAIAIMADQLVGFPAYLQPRYGKGVHCWISQKYALLTFFIFPIGLSMLINVILFGLILQVLCQSRPDQTQPARSNALVYLKIFVLMGLTWIIGIIAELSDSVVLFYVFTLVNASQGTFLLLVTILSSRTRLALKNRISAQDHQRGSLTTTTTRTTVSL